MLKLINTMVPGRVSCVCVCVFGDGVRLYMYNHSLPINPHHFPAAANEEIFLFKLTANRLILIAITPTATTTTRELVDQATCRCWNTQSSSSPGEAWQNSERPWRTLPVNK